MKVGRKIATTLGIGAVAALTAGLCNVAASSADATTGSLISGTLTGANNAAASGDSVQLEVWPVSSVLASEAVGDTVPTKVIATTTSSSTGAFTLNPSLATLGTNYIDTDGTIDADVDVFNASAKTEQVEGIELSTASSTDVAASDPTIITPTNTAVLNFNSSASTVSETVGSQSTDTESSANTATSDGNVAAPVTMQPDYNPNPECTGWKVDNKYYAANEKWYNLYGYGTAEVDESSGTSHKIEIGLEASVGGWGAHGKAGLGTSGGSGSDVDYKGNHQIYNLINYDKYVEHCYPTGTGPGYTEHEVRAVSFNNYQTSYPHIDGRSWASCTTHYKGSFYKDSGADQEFSAGISTPFLDLSVRVAYSKDYRVTWTVPSTEYAQTYGEQFCGSTKSGFDGSAFGGTQAGSTHGSSSAGAMPNTTADGGTCPVDNSDITDGDAAEVDTSAADANC